MADYIKSYSNFVIKKKHQDTNRGDIYERDITTIGGMDKFVPGQVPYYKSSNFLITINKNAPASKDYGTKDWLKNDKNSTLWTLKDVGDSTGDSTKIVLKKDYYKLKDFAYYGSCSELIRASINDIVSRFPGEIYAPKVNKNGIIIKYDTGRYVKGEPEYGILGGLSDGGLPQFFYMDNPFNINIYDDYVNEETENKLRYFANDGYSKYVIIEPDKKENPIQVEKIEIKDRKYECVNVGEKICCVTLNDNFDIYVYLGDNNEIFYLTDKDHLEYAIRPKKEYIDAFFDSLDVFEKVLLNRESKPKYSAIFEVMSENSFGYETQLKTFSFPLAYGEYNLSVNDPLFEAYINDLYRYANFYDELLCDNLYRSMTHEAIKNFDWSYTRKFSDGDEDEYVLGGSKIQKLIRLFGREFDEIKFYIDGINEYKYITYKGVNNMPDYFLSSELSNNGWVVKPIEVYNDKGGTILNYEFTPYSMNNVSDQNENKYKGYYFSGKDKEIKYFSNEGKEYDNFILDETTKKLTESVKPYSSEKKYTIKDVNSLFMRILKINTNNIFNKKGTIEGIESLLSLFGLKSERWCDNNSKYKKQWDYKIKEFSSIVESGVEDKIDSAYSTTMPAIDWINSTKLTSYNTSDYANGIYHHYQGLLVKPYFTHVDGSKTKYYYPLDKLPPEFNNFETLISKDKIHNYITLYPYFDKNKKYDGNPYYQMYGGWLKKNCIVIKDSETLIEDDYTLLYKGNLFTETHRNIKKVETLNDLISIPMPSLKENDIVFVENIDKDYVIVNGEICELFKDDNNKEFIILKVYNGTVKIGYTIFRDIIVVSTPNEYGGVGKDYPKYEYYLNSLPDDTKIMVYNTSDEPNVFNMSIEEKNQDDGQCYASINKFVPMRKKSNMSHYFKINNVDHNYEISDKGWVNIGINDDDLKKANLIHDDFNGNNPHSGNLNYDDGREYLRYFDKIFKYSLENSLFDANKYKSDELYAIAMNDDNKCQCGFGGIYKEKNCECVYKEDSKIHYMSESENTVEEVCKKIYGEGFPTKEKEYEDISDNSNISDKIINTKRVDIIFNNNHKTIYTIKFLNDVILPYLQEMLPSTLIIHLDF